MQPHDRRAQGPALVAGENRETARSTSAAHGSRGLRREAQLMAATQIDDMSDADRRTLTIAVRENGTTTELVVSGEWDLAHQQTARGAVKAALDRSPECVVLDLSQLSFIDSSGIHTVFELHNRAVRQNIHLVIIPGVRAVQRPFDICGLTDLLPFLRAAA